MPTRLVGLFIMAALSGAFLSACSSNNSGQSHLVSIDDNAGAANRHGSRTLPPAHKLQLIFRLKPRDSHLATVDVMLVEEKGRVIVHALSDGARFYVNLPPGKYHVLASVNGHDVEKTVRVEGASTTVSLIWPTADRKNPA